MTRRLLLLGVLLSILPAAALAQTPDPGDGVRVAVVSAPTFITVPEGEPLVLWVRSVEGKMAHVVVLVETKDGYVQLTPCDNVAVVCEDALIPAEGTHEGDTFYLASE
jgi:hypothetical protein